MLFNCNQSDNKKVTINPQKIAITKPIVEEKESNLDSTKLNINFKAKGDYNAIKHNMQVSPKRYFQPLYYKNKEKALDSASIYLYSKLINDIVPHWYGTPWEFSGHTNIPNKGEIACGYFVSTTLKTSWFYCKSL